MAFARLASPSAAFPLAAPALATFAASLAALFLFLLLRLGRAFFSAAIRSVFWRLLPLLVMAPFSFTSFFAGQMCMCGIPLPVALSVQLFASLDNLCMGPLVCLRLSAETIETVSALFQKGLH